MKKVCVVGAGPSGFYLTQELVKEGFHVTMIESSIVPYGLVRYGVAPDHYAVKKCTAKFEKIASSRNVYYIGNCRVGKDVSVDKLRECFDAVCLSVGSAKDRKLNIENESLKNTFGGKDFVSWYNGHPDYNDLNPILKGTVVIIGNGNVALDCARILLCSPEHLKNTDIAPYALNALENSLIQKVHVIGRRGVLQASFTSKEVRELLDLSAITFFPDNNMIHDIQAASQYLSKNRVKKRVMDILVRGSKSTDPNNKQLHLNFLKSPTKVLGNWNIEGLELEENELIRDIHVPDKAECKGTGIKKVIDCDLLIKCIGYQNQAFPGVPFKNGIIPHDEGRVSGLESSLLSNLYVSGWIKTGPTGVLNSTMFDAYETARTIAKDLMKQKEGSKPGIIIIT